MELSIYTPKEQWLLSFLREQDNDHFLSPSYIGAEYGKFKHPGNSPVPHSYHSAAVSKTLLRLVRFGLVERSSKGHYRIKK